MPPCESSERGGIRRPRKRSLTTEAQRRASPRSTPGPLQTGPDVPVLEGVYTQRVKTSRRVMTKAERVQRLLLRGLACLMGGAVLGAAVSAATAAYSFSSPSLWTTTNIGKGPDGLCREAPGISIIDNRRDAIAEAWSADINWGDINDPGTAAVSLGVPLRCVRYLCPSRFPTSSIAESTRLDLGWMPQTARKYDVRVAIPLQWQWRETVMNLGIWSVAAGCAGWLLGRIMTRVRNARRTRAGLCITCKYPLVGVMSVCPECGTQFHGGANPGARA